MDAQRKRTLQTIFDTVAWGYDRPAMAFFPATAERLLAHVQLDPAAHVLDVCTGTGIVSLRAAQLLPQGHVVGIDLSSGMLAQARDKARQAQLANIDFVQMDMEALTFAPHRFDAATCSFGLFFIDDMTSCLHNIAATIKPDGKLAISTFATGAFEPMASMFLRRYESFGKETHATAWKRIAAEPELRALFIAAGLDNVVIHHEPLSYPLSAEIWWDIVWNAGYRGYLQQLSNSELAEFRQQHQAEIETLCADGQTRLDAGVMIAVARVG